MQEFRKILPLLSEMPDDHVQMLITNQFGVNGGIAGVLKNRLIKLSVLKIRFCNSVLIRVMSTVQMQV